MREGLLAACGAPTNQKMPFVPLKIGAPSGVLFAQTARVTNALTRDGCAYPIEIGDKSYAPSPQTKDAVVSSYNANPGKPSAIKYRITGYTAEIECGFGWNSSLAEIEVLAISPVCTADQTFATTCVQCGAAGGCAKDETKCTPTCSASVPCASGTCADGVCGLAPVCI